MRKKRLWVIPIFVLILSIMLFLRTYYLKKPIQKDNFLFGTLIRITAYGPGASNAIDRAFTEMSRIESFTAQDRGEISNINLNAGKEPVKIGDELFSLLQVVFKLAEESEGYFNPVIGALVEIWGFGYGGEGRLPLVKEISSILPITKRELVEFNEEEKTIFLLREGMKIDLGGVAKGYALDRAWEILKSSGVKGALINGGESSIRVLGERPGGGPWRIAISHPRKEKWIGILELCSGKAVGTSADTERYIEKDGRRYSHLLNPNTGYSPSDLFSATVIADTALEADLYSTAVFVAEGVERLEYLTNRGLEGVVVYSDLNIKATKGIKKMIIY